MKTVYCSFCKFYTEPIIDGCCVVCPECGSDEDYPDVIYEQNKVKR